MWGGGQGYVIQNAGTSNGDIKNVYGFKCRHVVDHSWSDSCVNDNITADYGYDSTMAVHGIGEHDLIYKRCSGVVTLGHGMTYFSEIMGSIKFEDCNISSLLVDASSYIEKLHFKDSKVSYSTAPYAKYLKIEGSVTTIMLNTYYNVIAKRGLTFDAKVEFTGGQIILSNPTLNINGMCGFYGAENIVIDNVEYSFDHDPLIYTYMLAFALFKAKSIKLSRIKHSQMCFGLYQVTQDVVIDVSKCYSEYLAQAGAILLRMSQDVNSNSNFYVNLFGNTLVCKGTSGYVQVLNFLTASFTACTAIARLKDNNFLGISTQTIDFVNQLGSLVTIADRDNVIKSPRAGNAFTVANNTYI